MLGKRTTSNKNQRTWRIAPNHILNRPLIVLTTLYPPTKLSDKASRQGGGPLKVRRQKPNDASRSIDGLPPIRPRKIKRYKEVPWKNRLFVAPETAFYGDGRDVAIEPLTPQIEVGDRLRTGVRLRHVLAIHAVGPKRCHRRL